MRRKKIVALLPLAVVVLLALFTVIVHAVEQPDPTDASFLSPVSDADDGAAALAARLTAEGVSVDRQTNTPDALSSAAVGDATLFVTTPGLVYPDYLRLLTFSGARVVLVAPDANVLSGAGLSLPLAGPRWTAAAPQPGCSQPFATRPAAVLRWQFGAGYDELFRCYEGGLVEVSSGRGTIALVGASDPFRNDRLVEHGNADLAVGLLARGNRVVWLDLHDKEDPPPAPEFTPPTYEPDPEPTDEPEYTGDDGDGGGPAEEPEDRPVEGESQADGPTPNPLTEAFPPSFWATALVLLLALLALAAARARRLGAPVAEPLPARVRAAETVRGLGGLYRRARARDASLGTIQAAACRRLAHHFGLPPGSGLEEVAARVAAFTGQPVGEVRSLLGTGAEDDDENLAAKAAAVQDLVRHVTGHQGFTEGTPQ